ncbi:MAG: L,D-transpeptidase [Acidobacteriota bacterium]
MTHLKTTMIALSCLVLSIVPVTAQTRPVPAHAVSVTEMKAKTMSDARPTSPSLRRTEAPADDLVTRVIVVSLEDRRLALVEDGVVKRVYRVAVGRVDSPSPTGTFTIVDRVENPTYYHPGAVIPPGPGNPVGTRWIGLDKKGYGIHGTNMPHSIGKAASHGCIRMARHDLEALFAEVRSGDEVEIIGQRSEATVAIFGGSAIPGAVPAPTPTVAIQETTEVPAQSAATETTATAVVPISR